MGKMKTIIAISVVFHAMFALEGRLRQNYSEADIGHSFVG